MAAPAAAAAAAAAAAPSASTASAAITVGSRSPCPVNAAISQRRRVVDSDARQVGLLCQNKAQLRMRPQTDATTYSSATRFVEREPSTPHSPAFPW
eukprot:6177600-Pleurochrysis_carterae.AAC.3